MYQKDLYKQYNLEQLLKDGDLDTLYMCCENVIFKTYKKYSNIDLPEEDKHELGYIAFMIAAKTFNPDMGYKFSTYLITVLTNEILNCYKKKMIRVKYNFTEISLNSIEDNNQSSDHEYDFDLSDMLPDKFSLEEHVIALDTCNVIIQTLKQKLTDKQFEVLSEYLKYESSIKAAKKLNISGAYVRRVRSIAKEKVREICKEGYLI